jgi:response regulator NasT
MAKVRILICEDEGLTALRLKATVAKLGHEVAGEARNGEEAVAEAARLQPDAILMDVRMPKLDGISATEQIMQARPTAIVMITA